MKNGKLNEQSDWSSQEDNWKNQEMKFFNIYCHRNYTIKERCQSSDLGTSTTG